MEFFRIHRTIPFMRHALVLNIVSFATFALAVFFLFHRGLHLSVEFTGGTVMEVAYTQSVDVGQVRETIGKLGYAEVQVQNFGTSRDVQIRLPVQKGQTSAQQSTQVMDALKAADPDRGGKRPTDVDALATEFEARMAAILSPRFDGVDRSDTGFAALQSALQRLAERHGTTVRGRHEVRRLPLGARAHLVEQGRAHGERHDRRHRDDDHEHDDRGEPGELEPRAADEIRGAHAAGTPNPGQSRSARR